MELISPVKKLVMKHFFIALLASLAATALAAPPSSSCAAVSPELAAQREMTISEIESERMEVINRMRKIDPIIPPLPFGFVNAEWLVFKKMVRPGDKIIHYSSDFRSWQNRAGEMGYALIRSGCVIKVFRGLRN